MTCPPRVIPFAMIALTVRRGSRTAKVSAELSSRKLFRIFLHPIVHEFRDLITIFLEHHLVAISVNPHVFKAHELRLHARLIEPFLESMIVFTVIAALRREV